MFHFSLLTADATAVQSARSHFPAEYVLPLEPKSTFTASIVARQAISQIARESYGIADFLPIVDNEGVPVFSDGIFWSISHSWDRLFAAVADCPIGADIEKIKPRDESLFSRHSEDEWWTLGSYSRRSGADCTDADSPMNGESIGIRPNWPDFYRLWTAKESVIKMRLGKLDDMESLVLSGIWSATEPFDRTFSFVWHARLSTYSAMDEAYAFSITVAR